MELLYPGYKSYFGRFRTEPFHTEYSTRYCNSEAPVLNSQVPKYTWFEPRRPTVAARREVEATTKLTHLRPPFAARMTSYEPEEKYHGEKMREEATFVARGGSPKGRSLIKLPVVSPPSTAEKGLSRKEIAEDHGFQMARMSPAKNAREVTTSAKQAQLKTNLWFEHDHMNMSGPLEPRSLLASSFTAARKQKFHKAAPRSSTRDQHSEEARTSDPSISRYGLPLGRVAPRPCTLLSKRRTLCTRYMLFPTNPGAQETLLHR